MVTSNIKEESLDHIHLELARLKDKCRKRSDFEAFYFKVCAVCGMFIFPLYECIFFGYLLNKYSSFGSTPNVIFGFLDLFTGLILLAHLIFAVSYILLSGREDLRKFVELSSCIEHFDKSVTEKNEIQEVYTILYKCIDILRDIATKKQECLSLIKSNKNGSFEEEIGHVISKFSSTLPSLFGFDGNVRYNFSIYMLDVDSMSLKCEFRRRDPHSEEVHPQPSRSWKAGQGHIGKCFSNVVSFVDKDITQDPMFSLVNNDPEDKHFYRSAISVPLEGIVSCVDRDHCERQEYGVMLLTCSIPGKLTNLHLEIMISLKMLLEEFIYSLWEVSNDSSQELPK